MVPSFHYMKFAIIAASGKQYKVHEGQVVTLDRQPEKKSMKFSNVLLIADDKKVSIGTPALSGVSIPGEILDHPKGKKVFIVKFKSKVHYKRRKGHRQHLTRVKIGKIPNP